MEQYRPCLFCGKQLVEIKKDEIFLCKECNVTIQVFRGVSSRTASKALEVERKKLK